MEEAEILCDRVAIMDRGKIIAIDDPRRLVEKTSGASNLEDVFIELTGGTIEEEESV